MDSKRRRGEVFVRAAPALVLLAALVAFAPAVLTPLVLDDFLHLSMVEGTFPARRGPLDLYDFVDDDVRPRLVERGLLPWWSHPKLKLRFFRPLSSALLWADHRVFRHAALPMHLHSLAWWIAGLVAVRALFRRAFAPRVAAIATGIYALARCHMMPLAWLANREALVSLVLGAFALAAHARWREERRARDVVVATLLFALAFAGGGEYALTFGGYVLAMELVDRGDAGSAVARAGARGAWRRVTSVAPFALPAAAYLALRARLGYGTFGSGFYADPLRDPVGFLRAAPWRSVALLSEGWLTLDTREIRQTSARIALGVFVALAIALAWSPMRRAIARLDAHARITASWMLVGSLLSLLPVMAAVPSARLLGVSAIGIAAAVAVLVDHAWFDEEARSAERAQSVALALGFAHFVHGPVSSWLAAKELHDAAVKFQEHARWLTEKLGDPTRAEVGVIRGFTGMFFAPFALDARGAPPAHWYLLADTGHVLALRKDARTIELKTPLDAGIHPMGGASLFRGIDAPLKAGEVIDVPGMRVAIVDVGPEGPRDVVFTFTRDLESMTKVWITEELDDWSEVAPPNPGFGAPFDP